MKRTNTFPESVLGFFKDVASQRLAFFSTVSLDTRLKFPFFNEQQKFDLHSASLWSISLIFLLKVLNLFYVLHCYKA